MMEKIVKLRELYICKYGKEPTAVILGYMMPKELMRKFPTVINDGKNLFKTVLGMRIIIDKNKPTRVEVGDFDV